MTEHTSEEILTRAAHILDRLYATGSDLAGTWLGLLPDEVAEDLAEWFRHVLADKVIDDGAWPLGAHRAIRIAEAIIDVVERHTSQTLHSAIQNWEETRHQYAEAFPELPDHDEERGVEWK